MDFVSAAIGIGSTIAGIFGANKQAKVEKERTQLAYEDNLEKIRRREFTQKQTQGAAKALSENAGVLHTGGSTAQGTLDVMEREFKYELDWMKKYGERAKKLGIQSANVNQQTNVMGAITGGINTGLSVYGALT